MLGYLCRKSPYELTLNILFFTGHVSCGPDQLFGCLASQLRPEKNTRRERS
jgi:hypothetical protein